MKLSVVALFSLSLAPVALSFSTSGAQWSNAKRMANGLPPLRPRKLYNGNVARAPAPSQVLVIPPSLPTSAGVSARVVQVYTQNTTPVRRQTVGASAGYLNQVAKLTSTNGNVKFSLTTDTEVAQGLYPTDYQQPTASTPISEFICLSNGHSADQTRTQPITLSPDTGDYLYLADCGADLDQPAGSPPVNNPSAVEPQYYGETRVWQVDPATGQITFHYVNPDGSVPSVQVPVTFGCPENGAVSSTGVYLTSNPQAFLTEFLQKWSYAFHDPGSCYVNEIALYYSTS